MAGGQPKPVSPCRRESRGLRGPQSSGNPASWGAERPDAAAFLQNSPLPHFIGDHSPHPHPVPPHPECPSRYRALSYTQTADASRAGFHRVPHTAPSIQ